MDNKNPIEYIAMLIEAGYNSGWSPRWQLIIENPFLARDEALRKKIAFNIRSGERKGALPGWKIENLQKTTIKEMSARKKRAV